MRPLFTQRTEIQAVAIFTYTKKTDFWLTTENREDKFDRVGLIEAVLYIRFRCNNTYENRYVCEWN